MHTNRKKNELSFGNSFFPNDSGSNSRTQIKKKKKNPQEWTGNLEFSKSEKRFIEDEERKKRESGEFFKPENRFIEVEERKRLEKKEFLSPNDLISGVFEIYGVGVNYCSRVGYGLPYGSGFMLTPDLVLTTNRNIPTSEHALVSILKFFSRPDVTYRLDPKLFFYTDYSKNITISAIATRPLHQITVLNPLNQFKLYRGDVVKLLGTSSAPCLVSNIAENSFSFRYSDSLLPGFPILSSKLKLQGMYISSSSSLSIKDSLRMDSIISSLLQVKNMVLHPDLEYLLSQYSKAHNIPMLQSGRLGDCKDFYWAESRSTNIYQYQHITRSWHSLQLVNLAQFKNTQQWVFPTGFRLVYLHDSSFLICGGINREDGRGSRETIQVYPSSGIIMKKHSMQEGRSGHCLIHRLGFVYAIGGLPRLINCERYEVTKNIWEPISSLIQGRVESSAILFMHDSYIMLVGGDAESGKSIERYSFQFDSWEEINVLLPFEFVNPGLYLVESNKIAIFGGRRSEAILLFEADTFVKESTSGVVEEVFRICQIDVLPNKLVTAYPCSYMWGKNVVYFINEKNYGMPEVLEYNVKKLLNGKKRGLLEFTNITKAGKQINDYNRLLTPSFTDVYY